jgi:hypothetical protein
VASVDGWRKKVAIHINELQQIFEYTRKFATFCIQASEQKKKLVSLFESNSSFSDCRNIPRCELFIKSVTTRGF